MQRALFPRPSLLTLAFFILPLLAMVVLWSPRAKAAACSVPSTDYGTVSNLSASVSGTGTYRIWSRMAAADTTNNTYLLEITGPEGTSCYTVGGSSVPTYTTGTSTYFKNDSTNWISKTNTGTQIDANLTAGTHTIKMIGNAPNVVVDRVVMTQDTACIPTGTGDNCANPPDTIPPVVSITSPANNVTISTATTVTANATDDVGVTKVEFYVDNVLQTTDTTANNNNFTYSLNPASFAPGGHSLTAKAYDAAGHSTTSSTISFTVQDKTAPIITAGPAASSLTQTTGTITWTTDESSDSLVEYGTTTAYGSSKAASTNVTSHSVGLTGLTASTTYHYKVTSNDAAGNSVSSTDKTFTTLAPAADTTKPIVSVSAPATGASVSGTTTVSATASDNVGVVGVQFKLDGNNLGSEDTTGPSPYTVSWNTTAASNGSHTLTAVARDAAGNTQTATAVTVTVNNPVTYRPEDINQDGHVDILDFSLLAGKFNQSGAGIGRADINGDGTVNILDFSLLATKFGT